MVVDVTEAQWFGYATGGSDDEVAFLAQVRRAAAAWDVDVSAADTAAHAWQTPSLLFLEVDVPGPSSAR